MPVFILYPAHPSSIQYRKLKTTKPKITETLPERCETTPAGSPAGGEAPTPPRPAPAHLDKGT